MEAVPLEPGGLSERNFVADMDARVLLVNPTRSLVLAPLTDAVRSPAGCASVGMLMTLIDLGASDPVMVASSPDWVATQDLALDGAASLVDGPVLVDNRLVRAGKKVVVATADIYDAGGVEDFDAVRRAADEGSLTLAASGLITFARIPRSAAPGREDYDPSQWVGQVRHSPLSVRPAASMYERIGLRALDAASGQLELERSEYVTNSIGTILGGALAVLVEAAAEAMRPGMVTTDMRLHYLSQLQAGPARTLGSVVRDGTDHSVVGMRVVDAGNDDQLLTLATATLRPSA